MVNEGRNAFGGTEARIERREKPVENVGERIVVGAKLSQSVATGRFFIAFVSAASIGRAVGQQRLFHWLS